MALTSLSKSTVTSSSKRKAAAKVEVDGDGAETLQQGSDDSDDSDDDEEDPSFINVDFDFRAPVDSDEAALRRLLRQLFHTHANGLELYKVSEEMIKLAAGEGEDGQAGMGTVIKVEGDEDQAPFAFVTGIELNQPSNSASSLLTTYLKSQLPDASPIGNVLSSVADPSSSRPWLYLHERFINLPAQVAPPLYRLLTEEICGSSRAEPSHVIFFGRIFSKEAYSDDEDEPMSGPGAIMGADEEEEDKPRGMKGAKRRKGIDQKKKKRMMTSTKVDKGERREWGFFRPEDELLEKNAEDSYESPLYGRIMLIEWEKIKSGSLWNQVEGELSLQTSVAEQQ